jgi:hypothetical protein
MQPCHTFEGILDQYRTSTHYAVYVRELGGEEVESWTNPGASCGNCHAIDAHEQRSSGKVTTTSGTVANVTKGQTNYLNTTTGKRAEAGYAGKAKVAQVHCTTCHKISADPHVTGAVYTPGTFAYWVPTGADDEPFIEKSPTVGNITGQAAGKFRTGNVCVWCHKARPDVTNYITAQTTLTSVYWGPHVGPQADLYSGKGGYHFAGKTYTAGHAHQGVSKGCVGCHMPAVATNKNYGNHSFYPQVSACAGCHAGAQSFNVNNGQSTVEKGLSELQAALNAAGYLTRGTEAPASSQPLTAEQLADKDFHLDDVLVTTPPKVVSAEVAGAIWNYLMVARGGGLGVHQPTYIKQLLWDSILVVKPGSNPSFIAARP